LLPLDKRESGRQRKLKIKGCLKGGHKKNGGKDGESTNNSTNGGDNATVRTNAKENKMIRGPMTCKRCSENGHKQASSKCLLNGTNKKTHGLFLQSIIQL
jgi:hypothetical protein